MVPALNWAGTNQSDFVAWADESNGREHRRSCRTDSTNGQGRQLADNNWSSVTRRAGSSKLGSKMFKRIIKTLAALVAGHGIQTVTQLLMPPAFIAAYGVKGYGEWLVLSAAVGYLNTLDFGLQTYVLNELTALYHRNETEQFRRVQSVGLLLSLMFVGGGMLLACTAFVLPVGELLKISGSRTVLSWTVFCLAVQVVAGIPLGQILGVYRTFGRAHRGVMWANLYRILLLAVTIGLALLRVAFWVLAAGQVLLIVATLIGVIIDLSLTNPKVRPSLDYWEGRLAMSTLKPSGFFGLFMLNNFLVYQAPLLLLQRFQSTEVVVVFSVARTLFSFVRQGVGLIQLSIAPEITRLHGQGDKGKLVRLYVLIEGLVMTLLLTVNAGLLLFAPTLLTLWLKRPNLFNIRVFVLVMLVSIVSSVKEYKVYFQITTNTHVQTGVMTFFSYALMILLSVPVIRWFGVLGFVVEWLCVELLQTSFLHYYNSQFFERREEISLQPALRLGLALIGLLLFVSFGWSYFESQNYFLRGLVVVLAMLLLTCASYFLFGSRELLQECRAQFLRLRKQEPREVLA